MKYSNNIYMRSTSWKKRDLCYYNYMANRHYSRESLKNAKNLRLNQTDAENILWFNLRNKKLAGIKFRRQVPIGKYIADFLCCEKS